MEQSTNIHWGLCVKILLLVFFPLFAKVILLAMLAPLGVLVAHHYCSLKIRV